MSNVEVRRGRINIWTTEEPLWVTTDHIVEVYSSDGITKVTTTATQRTSRHSVADIVRAIDRAERDR